MDLGCGVSLGMSAFGDVWVQWGEGAVFGLGLGACLRGRVWVRSSLWGATGGVCHWTCKSAKETEEMEVKEQEEE